MKTLLAALTLTFLAPLAWAAEIHGAWTAEKAGDGSVQFEISRRHGHHSDTRNLSDFAGLPAGVVDATALTPVNFTLQREAGSFAFEGTFKNGIGAGQFTFTPNPGYSAALRNLGVTFKDGEIDEDRQLTFAWLDISSAYIRSMQAEGYRLPGEQYVALRIFNVTPEYIHELRAAGYADVSADDLVASRIHKATPEFIGQLKAAGYDHVPFHQLIAFRIHRVTPEFIKELRAAGYDHIPAEKLVAMRIHGIDADYVKRMNAAK